jgi:hypothetical protein
MIEHWDLLDITTENFEQKALEVFSYQYDNCSIYRQFCNGIHVAKNSVHSIVEIPFLPISFFKTHPVIASPLQNDFYFESSGTSGMITSKHFIADLGLYHQSIDLSFESLFGDISKYTVFGLLPHYLERSHSSLVYMVQRWTEQSQKLEHHFYLNELETLKYAIENAINHNKKIILIGISFAIIDFMEQFASDYKDLIIIETGGMKGTRREIPKNELLQRMHDNFPHATICSEYGMCELLSQSYAINQLKFKTPLWKKALVSDVNNPLSTYLEGNGVAKIIDLANIHSCSFIETQDLISLSTQGDFEILGRKDNSDIRGCSLMYA